MQTKNVNLLQQGNNSASAPEVAVESEVMVSKEEGYNAPPLPPRGAVNTQAPPPCRPKTLQQATEGVYKPVPLPKPVPPPYRQPPFPPPIYSNPSSTLQINVPGTIQPANSGEAINTSHNRKNQTKENITTKQEVDDNDIRIPTLAEVMKANKGRLKGNSNAVRPEESKLKAKKQQQAWTEGTAAGHNQLMRKSIVMKSEEDVSKDDGEPLLLVRSTSGPLYPAGIDNFGADDVAYIPSQPHEKKSRGQNNDVEVDTEDDGNVYRAFCVTTEVDTVTRGPELSIRDACNRMYSTSNKSIHSSLQNLKLTPQQQPYYHLKDMRSGDEENGRMYSRVSAATKMAVEGAVVYGTTTGAGVDLCARSPAQQLDNSTSTVPTNERISSTSSESGRGTMPTGATLSGVLTLNSSSESAIALQVSSGNRISPVDVKEKKNDADNLNESLISDRFSVTPPLPPLSPATTPPTSPTHHRNKHKSRRTPDIVETTRDGAHSRQQSANRRYVSGSKSNKGLSGVGMANHYNWINKPGHGGRGYTPVQQQQQQHHQQHLNQHRTSNSHNYHYKARSNNSHRIHLGGRVSVDTADGDVTSTTTGLDIDSLLDDADLSSINSSTSTDDVSQSNSIAEIGSIRKQLESLEGMYSEVMRALGLPSAKLKQEVKKKQLPYHGGSGRVVSSKPQEKTQGKKHKGITKRFQRLESHVVTLARSVAHLSSEMRTQHLMFQELETLRQEVGQLNDAQLILRSRMSQQANANARTTGGANPSGSAAPLSGGEWDNFRSTIPSLTNPSRVKKLTHFFGDEPPLLRLFLKKLGYEKYACLFETEKIGIIELPYLTEERLQKIGIPMGPRMRILQEAQMSFRQEHFNIYIV
ncbi:hypothetical protein CHUAL_008516 [Chamberlinius hualienensis]